MKLFLFLFLWAPSAMADDDPDEAPATEEEEEAPPERVRPTGLQIRVPPKGSFEKEAAEDTEDTEDTEVEPAPIGSENEPEGTPARTRPTGQPFRVPPQEAFQPEEPTEDTTLDVPGLPTYLLPAVGAEQKERGESEPESEPESESESEGDPTEAVPTEPEQTDDEFLEELERELQNEIEAESAIEDQKPPPVTDEPTEPAAPPPPPDPVTWEAYQAKRLRFVANPRDGAFDRTPPWTVKTGAGKRMTAHQFARMVGDTETLTRLVQEETWGSRRGYILAGVGGGLIVGAAASLVNLGNVESQYQTPLPQEGEFSDYSEYLEALDSAESANDAQKQAAQEDRVWTAVALASMGAITLTVAPRSKDAVTTRQRNPANYYSHSDADHWMNVYNATVRQELGLPAFEGAPVKPSQRLEEADSLDDLDTELEELEREEAQRRDEEPQEGPGPEEAGEPAPEDPEEPSDTSEDSGEPASPNAPGKPGPELQFQVGPGWFGLTGRF